MLIEALQENILSAFVTTFVGALTFLVRHYFATLRKDIADAQKDFAKIAGHIDALATEIRQNTIQSAITSTEVKAIWRHLDGAYERTSDKNGGHP